MVDLLALNLYRSTFFLLIVQPCTAGVSLALFLNIPYKLVYYYSKYKFEFKYPFLAVDLDDVLCLGVSNEIK